MQPDALRQAVFEAQRFIKAAQVLQAAATADSYAMTSGMAVASCKRASMDLTRALAIIRRPDRGSAG